jgi:hypothetical protein
MALAAMHLLYAAPLWVLVAVGIAGASVECVRAYDAGAAARGGGPWRPERSIVFAAIVLGASAAFSFVGALSPEVQFDARAFYLAEAVRFAQHHGLFNILHDEHFIAYALVHFQEVLYGAAIVMGGTAAAKALAWCALPLAAAAVYLLARTLQASRFVATIASILFVSTPIVSWSAATASTDLPRVAPDLVALYAILRWTADRDVRWLVLAGVLVGFVLDIKAMGLFSLAALALIVAVTTYRAAATGEPARVRIAIARSVGLFVVPALVAALPWLITSWIDSGDPVFPFFAAQLAPEYFTAAVADDWAHAYEQFGANMSLATIFSAPWRLTVEADKYRNIIGPVYLALVALVGYTAWNIRRDGAYRACTAYVGVWFIALYLGHTFEARYAEPAFAVLAVLTTVAVADLMRDSAFWPVGSVAAVVLAAGIALDEQPLAGYQRHSQLGHVSGLVYYPWDYLYGNQSYDDVQLIYVPAIKYTNARLDPERDKIYDQADLWLFNVYSSVPFYHGSGYDSAAAGGSWNLRSADAPARLKELGIDYVAVFVADAAALRGSALWPSLRQIARIPHSSFYTTPAKDVVIYHVDAGVPHGTGPRKGAAASRNDRTAA